MSSDKRSTRYGIAEWFGRRVQNLTEEERAAFAQEARKNSPSLPCLPRADQSGKEGEPTCNKQGGVCSIRLYAPDPRDDSAGQPAGGPIVALCPHRLEENDKIYSWAGGVILGNDAPDFVKEIPFLERDRHSDYYEVWGEASNNGGSEGSDDADDDVGRIDGILLDATVGETRDKEARWEKRSPEESASSPREQYEFELSVELENWCGLEIQSVYFSGDKMSLEYAPFTEKEPPHVPFPKGKRRPDFRSSSAKRLLPQLQTKIPSLRRWGKKMAVVVDEAFFYEMAEMDAVEHLSNCDIVWVVTAFQEDQDGISLKLRETRFTTLEDSVVGLTAGKPVSRGDFEQRITSKLREPYIQEYIDELDDIDTQLRARRDELKTKIRDYIDRMKELRKKRAEARKQLKRNTDESKRAQLEQHIESYDERLESLGRERSPIEDEEERLKEHCKANRAVRAALNKQIG